MPKKDNVTKLYVRFSTSKDVKSIMKFYIDNKHEHVAIRDADIIKDRIRSGSVTLIEDAKGNIYASSISYPISKKGKDNHEWTEVGSTRITLGGLGLFKTLISAQILHAYLFEPPEDRFVIEIDNDNKRSHDVFKKIGAKDFKNAPKEIGVAANLTMRPEDRTEEVDWFQVPFKDMNTFSQNILDVMKNNILTQKHTGKKYELDFSKSKINKSILEDIIGSNKTVPTNKTKNPRP